MGFASNPSFHSWRSIAVVLALTFAIYIPTLRYQFVHDDRGQIVENPAVHSWRYVPTYFTSHVWAAVVPEDLGNYYRPLFLLWLRINDAVFGNRAWGWHLTTIMAHVFTTLLVYLLALRLGIGRDVGLLAALVFGLHPAHIEGVAWISGVTEPLLGILLIASFLCYVQWRPAGAGRLHGARRWQLISLFLFALAMAEKETALILPGLLLVYEWLFKREAMHTPASEVCGLAASGIEDLQSSHSSHRAVPRNHEKAQVTPHLHAPSPLPFPQGGGERGRGKWVRGFSVWVGGTLRQTWPYFFLVALYIPVRIYALRGFSHVVTPLRTEQLIFTWPLLIWFWIRHLVWPVGLSTFYDLAAVIHPTLKNFILPAIFDIGVGVALFVGVRRSRVATFFAVWLVLPLVPILNLRIFVADDFAHDRYLYLPSVGVAVLAALVLKKVADLGELAAAGATKKLWGASKSDAGGWSRLFLLATALCLTAVLSYGTMAQSFYFRDNLTFYAYCLTTAPHNPAAECNYATVLAESGMYGVALARFADLANRYPNYGAPVYDLGLTYYKMGRLAEAEKYLLQSIRINPHKPDEHFYLGMTRFKFGRTQEAMASVRQAIAINPTGFAYHFALGVMLKTQGDLEGARREFQAELATYPEERAAATQIKEIENQLRGTRSGAHP